MNLDFKEYLLLCIGEEAAEIAQACSKSIRFGTSDIIPEGSSATGMTNGTHLIQEINELIALAELLGEEALLNISELNSWNVKLAKKEKFYKYLDYARRNP